MSPLTQPFPPLPFVFPSQGTHHLDANKFTAWTFVYPYTLVSGMLDGTIAGIQEVLLMKE